MLSCYPPKSLNRTMPKSNKFSLNSLPRPITCLAPMAGYTDSAYRQIVKSISPETVCFSELTSINALEYGSEKTEKMLKFNKSERPIIIQLFGNKQEYFKAVGKKIESLPENERPDGIDINMGCPAPKVTKNGYGSALLKNPALVGKIVKALTNSTKIPVSVKMRIGYSTYEKAKFLHIIKIIEKSGASSVTIHGRTTKQGYSGEADFEPIYLAKQTLKIPVIGNGDIDSAKKALAKLKSPDGKIILDGLMIGRASIGNPWVFKEIQEAFSSHSPTKEQLTKNHLDFKKKLPVILRHLKLAIKIHGEKIGLLEMRKHLAGYINTIPNASKYRTQIMQAESAKEVELVLKSIKA